MKFIGENRVTVSTQDADTNDVTDHLEQLVGRGGVMYLSEMDGSFWLLAPYSDVVEDGGHYNIMLLGALPRTFPDFQFKMMLIPSGADGAAGADGADGDAARLLNSQTGTTYTFALADAQKFLETTNSSPVTLTIPTQASVTWLDGTVLQGVQNGDGQVEIDGAIGVNLYAAGGLFVADRFGVFEARRLAEDEWVIYGRMTT
jgi:hypothetical protein